MAPSMQRRIENAKQRLKGRDPFVFELEVVPQAAGAPEMRPQASAVHAAHNKIVCLTALPDACVPLSSVYCVHVLPFLRDGCPLSTIYLQREFQLMSGRHPSCFSVSQSSRSQSLWTWRSAQPRGRKS